jgi:hypothetical protein
VTFEVTHLIDDGAVFYVGGAEALRYTMTVTNVNCQCPSPVVYTNLADAAIEASIQTASLDLAAGDNALAVEVHQANEGSSDVLFGLRIVAVVGQAPPSGGGTLNITQDATSVTVTWDDPSMILLSSPAPEGPYTEVVGATSPYTLSKPLSPDMLYFGLGQAP